MFIAQPTLSQQIRRLEEIVGTQLLPGCLATEAASALQSAAAAADVDLVWMDAPLDAEFSLIREHRGRSRLQACVGSQAGQAPAMSRYRLLLTPPHLVMPEQAMAPFVALPRSIRGRSLPGRGSGGICVKPGRAATVLLVVRG